MTDGAWTFNVSPFGPASTATPPASLLEGALGESLQAASDSAATHAKARDGSVLDIRYIKVSSVFLLKLRLGELPQGVDIVTQSAAHSER
jgi:hypothetical protein